ncbi:hypothetical protein Q006_00599 [Pseudomonas aeruginosa UDL]|nr:hypothetical protein Q006_00599 [Pseudomonas aeruginosa UDL]
MRAGSSPRMWGTPDRALQPTPLCTVHPHACGEHPSNPASGRNWIGSSPRMWGTHFRNISVISATRFIPTHVGNTRPARADRFPGTVHPHACGEHFASASRCWAPGGSSPRMWGTRRPTLEELDTIRFIPTHVGNTSIQRPTRGAFSVHPHACGEHAAPDPAHDRDSRFIPTHVGNTCSASRWSSPRSVHPHACGEHASGNRAFVSGSGSSPRMWGTPPKHPYRSASGRFIPTHVGNTSFSALSLSRSAVHPHACGEHGGLSKRGDKRGGSSPRMWGTPGQVETVTRYSRFIPTHVGNTYLWGWTDTMAAVHPHACGEHTYRTALFLKKKKHLEKSTASSSIPWSDPEAGMPPIAARRTTLDVDG